jgi:hypothetical protein
MGNPLQESFDRKNPPRSDEAVSPAPSQNLTPSSSTNPVQQSFDTKNPTPAVSDVDLGKINPWEKPSGVPWTDYIYAQAHNMGRELGSAASNVARAYTDDYTMGTSDIARAAQSGEPLKKVRADTEAAKQDLGASRYGISAMAALTPNPVGWVAKGARIANAIEKPIAGVVGPLGKRIASGIGRFVEGGAYTGAQDVGHGQTDNLTRDMLGGGLFTAGLGMAGDEIPAVGQWARQRWSGTPEATPGNIANAPFSGPGGPAAAQNAAQFKTWLSNTERGKPPTQAEVSAHATALYGPDLASWPQEMQTLYKAAGSGGKGVLANILSYGGSQAAAGAANAATYALTGTVDPGIATALHAGAGFIGDAISPMVKSAVGAAPSTSHAILDAYPALTGYRVAPSAPSQQALSQDWTKFVTGLANPNQPRGETITPGWAGPLFSGQ